MLGVIISDMMGDIISDIVGNMICWVMVVGDMLISSVVMKEEGTIEAIIENVEWLGRKPEPKNDLKKDP